MDEDGSKRSGAKWECVFTLRRGGVQVDGQQQERQMVEPSQSGCGGHHLQYEEVDGGEKVQRPEQSS